MAQHQFIEDEVLRQVFSEEAIWKQTYEWYRPVFVDFVQERYGISVESAKELLAEAFAALRQLVAEGRFRLPLKRTLFAELLLIADVFQRRKADSPSGLKLLKMSEVARQGLYLSSEIMVLFLQKDHQGIITALYHCYQPSVLAIMYSKLGKQLPLDPMEIYGVSFNAMLENAKAGKINFAMTSKLFTYFFRIFRNQYLTEWGKEKQREENIPTDPLPEPGEGDIPDQEDEPDDFDLPLGFLDATDLIEYLLNQLSKECQEIITLRYFSYPNRLMSWKEIAEILGITENNARKRRFDCMEKLRENFREMRGE